MAKSSGGGGRIGRAKVQSFQQFSASRRLTDEPDHSFLRGRKNVSGRAIRAQDRRYIQEVNAKYTERASLRKAFDREVAAGNIRPPTRTEVLIQKAQGHPDNPSTQAARRLLNKQGVKF